MHAYTHMFAFIYSVRLNDCLFAGGSLEHLGVGVGGGWGEVGAPFFRGGWGLEPLGGGGAWSPFFFGEPLFFFYLGAPFFHWGGPLGPLL